MIFEALSHDSTEGYDRGEKFAHYMRFRSLDEYVLVSQDEKRIEIYRRPTGRGHWSSDISREGESVTMHGHTFSLDDIYRQ